MDASQSDLSLTSLASNYLLANDTVVDLFQQFDILSHVNVCRPTMSDSKEHFLEHDQVHCLLLSGVVDPLLCYLTVHLLLSV